MGRIRVRLREVEGELGAEVASSHRGWRRRAGILLELRDAEGLRGLGEASPLPGYSSDSLDSARGVLEAWARRPPSPEPGTGSVSGWLEEALAPLAPGEHAARFAAETALLDLLGRRRGAPIHRLLGSAAEPAARPLAALLPSAEPEDCLAAARQALAAGVGTCKLKIGASGRFGRELELLGELRRTFGARLRLRLDANGAWSAAEAAARLGAVAEFEPELLEEPVRGREWARLADSPLPLAMDESLGELGRPGELEPLAARGLFRALVLKPMALGGALRCLELAHWAAARGVATFVTHLFDGPVALAAACHLALALPGEVLASGLAPHAGLAIWPRVEQPLLAGGAIRPGGAPGLGVDLPEWGP